MAVQEVQFSPSSAGSKILWKVVPATSEGVGLIGAGEGSFANGSTVTFSAHPSTTSQREVHPETYPDLMVYVGIDQNDDGVLQSIEMLSVSGRVCLIGKPEYDYCLSNFSGWLYWLLQTFGLLQYPRTAEALGLFLNDPNGYQTFTASTTDTLLFGNSSSGNEQSNGLGVSSPSSFTEGPITKYVWDTSTSFSSDLLGQPETQGKIVQAIQGLDIGQWYANNPTVTEHHFENSYSGSISYISSSDFHNSIHGCAISLTVELETQRGTGPTPLITFMHVYGIVTDLYDFDPDGDDNESGWAARLQTCHEPSCSRTAGEIYRLRVLFADSETYSSGIPIDQLGSLF